MNVVFWNTKNNENIDKYLIDIINEYNCDIIVLAEYINEPDNLCNLLSVYNKDFRVLLNPGCQRIKIIANSIFKNEILTDCHHYTIHSITSTLSSFILAAVHFSSNTNKNNVDRRPVASRLVHDIELAERDLGHRRSIIIGDFNFNPFEDICIEANALHAIPYRNIATSMQSRVVDDTRYNMFYNPMWNFYGDFKNPPFGTFFYSSSRIANYFWHIFDQVLFRPEISTKLVDESLKIISKTERYELLCDNGRPNKKDISDHLPIFFRLREDEFNA